MADTQTEGHAASFLRLGWLGIAVQAVLALNSIVLLAGALIGAAPGARPMGRTGYLALLADLSTLGAALQVFGTSLWLPFRVTRGPGASVPTAA